jgi:hypothetical protein
MKIPRLTLGFALILLPDLAQSHASQQGLVMLLPTNIYVTAGTITVAVTILIASLLSHGQLAGLFQPHSITKRPRIGPLIPSLFSAAILLGLIWLGLFGPRDPLANLMTLGIWTVLWIAFTLVTGLFGNLWAWINPWSGLFLLLSGPNPTPPYALPNWVGQVPAMIGFLAFNGLAIADPAAADPAKLAILAAIYWMFTFVMMMLFGAKSWTEQGEFLSVFFGLIARISPFGNAPTLSIGTPGWRIATTTHPTTSLALFAILMLGTGTFDGLNETFFWLGQIGVNPLEFPGRSAIIPQTLAGFLGLNAGLCALVYLCIRLTAPAQHATILFHRQAFTLLPIALAYHFAHFLPTLLVDAQYTLKALTDPLKSGADILNFGQFYVTTGFFNTPATVRLIFLTQAGAIVLGHILAILLSHRIAADYFKTRREILISQIPLSVFMVFYTVLGLWLLATPKGA